MHADGSSDLGQFLDALASFSRLIFFDRRGTGASDGLARNAMPAWEEWAEDVRAVLDAAGSDRTAIFGGNNPGLIAMMFAALHPGHADDVEFARSFARTVRASATPRNAAAQYRYILENVDVRSVLRLIQAPTLVLHSSHDVLLNLDHGRYLADHIPGAKFVEVPGHGHLDDEGESAFVVGEIAEFLTGERPVVDVDRVLTTVVVHGHFSLDPTVDLRRRSGAGGSLLGTRHDRAVREQLRRFSRGGRSTPPATGSPLASTGPGGP